MTGVTTGEKRTVHRSPGYPAVSLPKAIEYVKVLYEQDKQLKMALPTVAKHLGLGERTSSFMQLVATFKKFGLTVDEGTTNSRRISVSDLALHILKGPAEVKEEAIKVAALRPRIYAELWNVWGSSVPSEESQQWYLLDNRKFNQSVIKQFLRDFWATIQFAGLEQAEKLDAATPPDGQNLSDTLENSLARVDRAGEAGLPPSPALEQFSMSLPGSGRQIIIKVALPLTAEEYEFFQTWLEMLKGEWIKNSACDP